MNISSLTNSVCFDNIFKNCQKEDGTYDWLKIAKLQDLPTAFIDKYFFQIYQYREIERKENLSTFIIKKYGNYLNWNILFLNQNMEVVITFITMIVVWILGKLSKKNPKINNNMIIYQNIIVGIIATGLYFITTGDISTAITLSGVFATTGYDLIHNLEKLAKEN